jgi:hypothetical protein
MKKIAGSIYKQLMLDTGLASVFNPTTLALANTFIGLATLPAIKNGRIKYER